MRASQTQAPQPLPLPPPPLRLPSPPAAPRRGRHRSSYSSSSSSSSSVSSASTFFCPSPSPAPSPRASTTSLVPFSWERHPGVPKNSSRGGLASPPGTPLPLPPPLRSSTRRRRRRRRRHTDIKAAPASSSASDTSSDPFVAAIAECTRDDGEDDETGHGADAVIAAKDKLWLAPTTKPTAASGRAERPWRPAPGGFLGFLDLYGCTCKNAMAVADVAFIARRPVVAALPGPASRAARK